MQSSSTSSKKPEDVFDPLKLSQDIQFGKSSELRNPLRRDPKASLFIPRQKPIDKKPPPNRPISTNAAPATTGTSFGASQNRPQSSTQQSAHVAAQAYFESSSRPVFQPPPSMHIAQPTNRPLPTIPPRQTGPAFSSLDPRSNSFNPFLVPPKPRQIIDITQRTSDDEDASDLDDAALRDGTDEFGAIDPLSYMDPTRANENIKTLLEGAFDVQEGQPKIKLRKLAQRAAVEEQGNKKAIGSLAKKLAGLDVDPQEKVEGGQVTVDVENEDEDDDGTIDGLAVKLLPHQVEGVSWMINRETRSGKRGARQTGGILADDMGLGKTIQSIALILTNPRPSSDAKPEHKGQNMPGKGVGKGTLVVAPLALIRQWEAEIKAKVTSSHALKVLVHHGPSRTKSSEELKKYDVVITTYQILTSEHAGSNMGVEGESRLGCFGLHWYRVILDEAHSIKNRNAKSTLACCALNSWYRWCLTGTPMQNSLDELQSLLRFLQIKPYCELPSWKEQIIQPMKSGRGGLAMKRLNVFLKACMKRRTKDILKQQGALNFGGKVAKDGEEKTEGMRIVKREVETVECEFDDFEQEFYTSLENRAESRLKDMMDNGRHDYIGALVLLLRLRQACNHPDLIAQTMNKDKEAVQATNASYSQGRAVGSQSSSKTVDDVDDLTALMGGVSVGSKKCDVCQVELDSSRKKDGSPRCQDCEGDLKTLTVAKSRHSHRRDASKEKQQNREAQGPVVNRSRNRRIILDDSEDEDAGEWIGHGPEQHVDLGRAGGTDDEDAEGGGESLDSLDSDTDEEADETPSRRASTKIRQLLRILLRESPSHKTIVFSQFTSMLDLIEPHLRKHDLRYVRYDGSMRPDAREESLNALRNNRKTRVLLCSLKCGSLGLNLTAASRVVIVEPFWNPFVEEQAIDRVHRLNQTVDVKVYRLKIRDTVEERILELQERKRQLAAAAIEGGTAMGQLSMKDILSLFHRDAEHGEHDEDDRRMWDRFGGDNRLLDGSSSDPSDVKDLYIGKKGAGRREHDVYGRRW